MGAEEEPTVVESRLSSVETTFREMEDVFLQTQTKIWLGEVLHVMFEEDAAVADLLVDGELLFELSKVMWKKLVSHSMEGMNSKVMIYERTSSAKNNGRYMAYPKIDSFLKICRILGLTGIDLFSPSDVVEKRNTRGVCMCIRLLSRMARLKGLNVPDFDIVTYTIAMPKDMVDCIRRNLEQSQNNYQSSNSVCRYFNITTYRQQCTVGDDEYSSLQEMQSTPSQFLLASPESVSSSGITSLSSGGSCGSSSSSLSKIDPSESSLTSDYFYSDEYECSGKFEKYPLSKSFSSGNPVSVQDFVHNVHLPVEFRNSQVLHFCTEEFSSELDLLAEKNKGTIGNVLQNDLNSEEETNPSAEGRIIISNVGKDNHCATLPSQSTSYISEDGQSIISDDAVTQAETSYGSCISDPESVDGEPRFCNEVHSPSMACEKLNPNHPPILSGFHVSNGLISWDLQESSSLYSTHVVTKSGDGPCIDDFPDIHLLLADSPILEQRSRAKPTLTMDRSEKKVEKDCMEQFGGYSSHGQILSEDHELQHRECCRYPGLTTESLVGDLKQQYLSVLPVADSSSKHISSHDAKESVVELRRHDSACKVVLENTSDVNQCPVIANKDVEEGMEIHGGLVNRNEQSKEATGVQSKGKGLLKSIASGITVVGGALLLLHFGGRNGGTNGMHGITTRPRGRRRTQEQRRYQWHT